MKEEIQSQITAILARHISPSLGLEYSDLPSDLTNLFISKEQECLDINILQALVKVNASLQDRLDKCIEHSKAQLKDHRDGYLRENTILHNKIDYLMDSNALLYEELLKLERRSWIKRLFNINT